MRDYDDLPDEGRHNPPFRDMGVIPLTGMFVRIGIAFFFTRFIFWLLYMLAVPFMIAALVFTIWAAGGFEKPKNANEAHHAECVRYFNHEKATGVRDPKWFTYCQDMDF